RPVVVFRLDKAALEKRKFSETLLSLRKDMKQLLGKYQDDMQRREAIAAELEEKVARLSTDLSTTNSRLESLLVENEWLKSALMNSEETLSKRDNELSVALKLQVIREGDLQELQHRYSEAFDENNRLEYVIAGIRRRLNEAADCLLAEDEKYDAVKMRK